MPNPLTKRLAFWKDIYYGKVRVGMAIFITTSTVLLIIRDLFIAPEHRNFAILKYIPQWPWYWWALIGLVGLILLTLEGSYSKFQRDQIRFRGAYRSKRKERDVQHRSELLAAHVHGLAQSPPHQAPLTLPPPVEEGQLPSKEVALPELPSSIELGGRLILNVTPTYLSGLYIEHTAAQADKLMDTYKGKWLRVSGTVHNVKSRPYYSVPSAIVLVNSSDGGYIAARFTEQRWIDHVMTLRRGETIAVLGKLEEADHSAVWIEECELSSQGRS